MVTRVALTGPGDRQIWHMSSAERIRRMANAAGLETVENKRRANLLVDPDYVFDPLWLDHAAANPGVAITCGGRPVIGPRQAGRQIASETAELYNPVLRKRERPFMLPLTAATRDAAERASYDAAYKGVTDIGTKYVWREPAFHLVRFAARLGLSPNAVTAIGAVLCVAATFAFYRGHYWSGLALGFVFMVLDTVDGKLARCTLTSSRAGDIFDHGIDLMHPPFWWWAWGMGLVAYGTPLAAGWWNATLVTILVSYVVQRLIEGWFIAAFKMHIHVWRPIDSTFRLITARRNPNMLLLIPFVAIGRPDWGFIALALWSAISLLFHAVRLAQAYAERWRGGEVRSWLHQSSSV